MPAARLSVWDEPECRSVHEATLTVLDQCGVEVRNHPQALELFSAAGARVDGSRVRLSPDLVERALASAPRSWWSCPVRQDRVPSSTAARTATRRRAVLVSYRTPDPLNRVRRCRHRRAAPRCRMGTRPSAAGQPKTVMDLTRAPACRGPAWSNNPDFWIPQLFDRSVYDRWAAEGSRTLKDRVRAKVAALRAEEPRYSVDAAARLELADLMEEARSRA